MAGMLAISFFAKHIISTIPTKANI